VGTELNVPLQRVEAKDYLDVASILKSGVPLAIGLGAARTLFGQAFQPSECLKALVYFEGGDMDSPSPPVKSALITSAAAVDEIPEVPLANVRLSLP
jgi:hypothetical protein